MRMQLVGRGFLSQKDDLEVENNLEYSNKYI